MRERKMKGQGGPSPQVGCSHPDNVHLQPSYVDHKVSQCSWAGRRHQASGGRVNVAQRRRWRSPEEGQVVVGRMVVGHASVRSMNLVRT